MQYLKYPPPPPRVVRRPRRFRRLLGVRSEGASARADASAAPCRQSHQTTEGYYSDPHRCKAVGMCWARLGGSCREALLMADWDGGVVKHGP